MAPTSVGQLPLGRVVITPVALAAIEASGDLASNYIDRHATGYWGELDAEDVAANEHALQCGLRVLSSYRLRNGTKFWVITEADRTSTCLLLPSEY